MRLEVEGLSVALGGRTVLKEVSFALQPGEVLGLIGANGAGKTTLLKAVMGLVEAAGEITLDGAPLSSLSRGERARALAYLEQGREVHWPLAAERLVALGRIPHGAAPGALKADDAVVVARVMAATDCQDLRGRPFDELSGGEQARLLLARALAVEAPLLLADEPIAALDPYHQLQVLELLRDAVGRGLSVLLVLHDLSLAGRFCDRLLLLAEDGAALAVGAPSDVLSADKLRRAYGIEAARGEVSGAEVIVPLKRADKMEP